MHLRYSTDDAIRGFVENLHALVAEPGILEVHDFDTADLESTVVPHFVGATVHDRARARLQYGIEQAEVWLAPVLGKDVLRQLVNHIQSLPIIATA